MKSRETRFVGGITALAALMSITTAYLAADTFHRQLGIKITNYTFNIILNDANNELLVQDTVEVQFLAAGVTGIDLDLCNFTAQARGPRTPSGISDPCAEPSPEPGGTGTAPTGGKGMTVTNVTSDGEALTFQHRSDRLHISLPRAFQPGDRYGFTVKYHGIPATGILIANNQYGDRGFFSNPWPDKSRNYIASIDHPYMKAPVVTIVTAPRHYQVISNGRLVQQIDLPGDLRQTTWKESRPICTWLMSLAVAPFAVDYFGEYHGVPLSSWVFPEEREVGFKVFRAYTQPILEFFNDRIGPYVYEKLAHVQANGVKGGMELASNIYYGYDSNGPSRQLIAHEMAHQWFGDSATEKDWDDVWLSEGLATYFALLYQEFQDGHDAFLEGVRRSKEKAIRYVLANPESTIVHDNLADVSKVIANEAQIYDGGAQVLHNIRGVLGTDTFWSGIRLYYRRFQNGNATTDDLRHAMEDACREAGNRCPADGRDLGWLFLELLKRGGVLQVRGSWHYDADAKRVQVTIDQTQASAAYRMPIEAAITVMNTTQPGARSAVGQGTEPAQPTQRIEVMPVTQRHQIFTFASESEPMGVTLDPNAWVMMHATFEKK